jgi:hypothetical protein
MSAAVQTPEQVTETLRWARQLYKREDRKKNILARAYEDGALLLMFTHPPIYSVSIPKKPRILLVGNKMDYERLSAAMPEVAKKYGLSEYEEEYSRLMGLPFWQHFFGNDDFLAPNATRDVPAAIITSGSMRAYMSNGSGDYFQCLGRIKEVAARWSVPVEVR